jgi:tRNA pseudouridine55 synthase
VHGWLVVDKPSGITSVAVMAAARRAAGAAKAGHGGTLDPLATGVLPIALGEATKTVSYVMDGTKSYRFTVCWGEGRDTDDAEGRVVVRSDVRPDPSAIRAILPRFVGEIAQVPPTFSAIKVDGRRAYALARADTPAALAARPVIIERIDLVDVPDADHAVLDVRCGKGVYMRSLARDLAVALGTVGHVSALRRIAVGSFTESEAVPLDVVRARGESGDLRSLLLPVGAALAGIPSLVLTDGEARRMRRGQAIAALQVAQRLPHCFEFSAAFVCATSEGTPVALAHLEGGAIRPVRVLNL